MTRDIRLVDVTLRDAHQCLWATRMTTAMMQDIAPRLDRAGFEAIDLVGGAVFDVMVRYLKEDPWERMRILNRWVTETPLIIHTRGQSLFTFEFFPDDIVELAAERFAANGMRYHTPYDPLNDMRNLEIPVKAAKRHELHVVGGLVYTYSPVHTDEYFARKAKDLLALGVDGIFLKDASGLLRPERVATLVPALKAVMGDTPLQIHTHCNSGLAPYVVLQAVEHGVDVVHTATSTLANGVSHSPTELVTQNLRRRGHTVDIDLEPVSEVAERLAFIARKEGKQTGVPQEYDEFHYHHQCAGGMVSNLAYQLETMGLEGRLNEILEEAGIEVSIDRLHLSGMISEAGYEGAGHWLLFYFRVLGPVEVQAGPMNEGNLEWHNPEDVANLNLPETDRKVIWPLVRQHRPRNEGELPGFFAVHVDCTGPEMAWSVEQSLPPHMP